LAYQSFRKNSNIYQAGTQSNCGFVLFIRAYQKDTYEDALTEEENGYVPRVAGQELGLSWQIPDATLSSLSL